jgi:aminoglycoside phosphotransferase (APT) family kinase protein
VAGVRPALARIAEIVTPAGDRRRLADACVLVPRILSGEAQSLPGCARASVIDDAELTSTGVAVIKLAPADRPPCLVVKVPTTTAALAGLERESAALGALHGDERLGDWRATLPRPCASGTALDQPFRADAALPGRPAAERVDGAAAAVRLQEAAAETIHVLHRSTATSVAVDRSVAERWIDGQLAELSRHAGDRRRRVWRLGRLRDELHRAVTGRTFSAAWIHGDYWLGNVLVDAASPTPRGIVDWDDAAPGELPLHDLLHLLLYTRRLLTGQELGQIVCRQLTGGEWSQGERRLLERYGCWCHDGALSDRHAVLLYWLRHVALHARQQRDRPGPRYRLWERRNVSSVLAAAWS